MTEPSNWIPCACDMGYEYREDCEIHGKKKVDEVKGKYRHFKGGLYVILGEALHTETGESLVIYQSAHGGDWHARPYSMFVESIIHNGKEVPRFVADEVTNGQ